MSPIRPPRRYSFHDEANLSNCTSLATRPCRPSILLSKSLRTLLALFKAHKDAPHIVVACCRIPWGLPVSLILSLFIMASETLILLGSMKCHWWCQFPLHPVAPESTKPNRKKIRSCCLVMDGTQGLSNDPTFHGVVFLLQTLPSAVIAKMKETVKAYLGTVETKVVMAVHHTLHDSRMASFKLPRKRT